MTDNRRLAAVMFTDISGYTSMMGHDEAIALETLEKNRIIHSELIGKYKGHFVKEVGDGVIAWFDSSTQALGCAQEILQRAEQEGYKLRFGIHQDDIVLRENDIFGTGVNVAARIEAAAVPGSIMFSEDVRESVANQSHLPTVKVGHYQLRNDTKTRALYALDKAPAKVPRPHEVKAKFVGEGPQEMWKRIAVAAIIATIVFSTLWVLRPDRAASPTADMEQIVLAIMPFETSDKADGLHITASSLAAGLSERLSNVAGLITIPAHETIKSKQVSQRSPLIGSFDFASLAAEMSATHYITGILDQQLSVEMRVANGKQLIWNENFPVDNPHRTIENIVQAVTNKLGISPGNAESITNRNPQATNLYLEALELWYTRSVESNLRKSIDLLRQAQKIDPDYPDVLGLLALCHATGTEREFFPFDSTAVFIFDYANETLRLDPDNAHALLSLGTYYSQLWDYDLAREYYLKAFSAAPDKGITSQSLGELDLITGQYADCLRRFQDARRAAPHDQYVLEHVAFAEMSNGFPNEYVKIFDNVVQLFPESVDSVSYKVYYHMVKEEYEEAHELLTSHMGNNPKPVWILTEGIIHVESGDQPQYARYIDRVGNDYPIGIHVHLLWLLQNGDQSQVKQAREICSQMMDDKSFPLIYLVQTYPLKSFNTLRTDTEIQSLARNNGITFTEHPYFKMKREFSPE